MIKSIPKADLHVHLEGAGDIETILELCQKQRVTLPESSPRDLKDFFTCRNFNHLLELFKILRPLWTKPENLETVIRRLIMRYAESNVVYFELRFNMARPVHTGLPYEEGMCAIWEALSWGREKFGIESSYILGFNRNTPSTVPWVIERCIDEFRNGRCQGLDISGDESGCRATKYMRYLREVASNGIPITVHAGESEGEESVADAIRIPGIRRIGHGTHGSSVIGSLENRSVAVEICLTSNLRTGVIQSLDEHPLKYYLSKGIPISINTDDPLMFDTDIEKEYQLCSDYFKLEREQLIDITRTAVKCGFLNPASKQRILERLS